MKYVAFSILLMPAIAMGAKFNASARVVTSTSDDMEHFTLTACYYGEFGGRVGNIGEYTNGSGVVSYRFFGDNDCTQ